MDRINISKELVEIRKDVAELNTTLGQSTITGVVIKIDNLLKQLDGTYIPTD